MHPRSPRCRSIALPHLGTRIAQTQERARSGMARRACGRQRSGYPRQFGGTWGAMTDDARSALAERFMAAWRGERRARSYKRSGAPGGCAGCGHWASVTALTRIGHAMARPESSYLQPRCGNAGLRPERGASTSLEQRLFDKDSWGSLLPASATSRRTSKFAQCVPRSFLCSISAPKTSDETTMPL